MCVLLSPGHSHNPPEHRAMSDKEVILATLNLKGKGRKSSRFRFC